MAFSPLVNQLIEALRCLPGVGPKSAQRMAFHLLERARDRGRYLGQTLQNAMDQIQQCQNCRMLTEAAICSICQNTQRDQSILCVVETPADVIAIEQTNTYRGLYFVLMGHLSPIDGIGPEELGISQFQTFLKTYPIREVILATNPTVMGEVTANYFADFVKQYQLNATRIAYGVPIGGELEFVDGLTLARAFAGRLPVME